MLEAGRLGLLLKEDMARKHIGNLIQHNTMSYTQPERLLLTKDWCTERAVIHGDR